MHKEGVVLLWFEIEIIVLLECTLGRNENDFTSFLCSMPVITCASWAGGITPYAQMRGHIAIDEIIYVFFKEIIFFEKYQLRISHTIKDFDSIEVMNDCGI